MNKQMQKNGFKNYILRGSVYFSLLALVLFGQIASASTYQIIDTNTYTNIETACTNYGGSITTITELQTALSSGDLNGLISDWQQFLTSTASSTDNTYIQTTYYHNDIFGDLEWAEKATVQSRGVCVVNSVEVASFFSDTNAFDNLSTVTNDTFSGVVNWLYLILGVVIAFFVIEKIIAIIPKDRVGEQDKKFNDMITRGTAMREKIEKLPE